jgi:hypothetical protein
MISHEHKCIFVEVPKTGTKSIRAIIGSPPKPHLNIIQIRDSMLNFRDRDRGGLGKFLQCFGARVSKGQLAEDGERQFNSYFKFGFVRNPWDRVVSLYHRREGVELRDRLMFDEFVKWIEYSSSTCIHPVPHTNQLDWFVDARGNVLVDFIGRFEQIQADWKAIASRLGLQENLPHRNQNSSIRPHYTDFYSKKTKQLVESKFRVDIEHFSYTFGE